VTDEKGAGQFLTLEGLKEALKQPELAATVANAIPDDTWKVIDRVKEERGRGRQSGRRETLNEIKLRQTDQDQYTDAVRQRDEAQKALSSPDGSDPTTLIGHARTLREKAELARDREVKADLFKAFERLPFFDECIETAGDRLEAVNGVDTKTWINEYLDVTLDVKGRQEYQRGLEQGRKETQAEQKLAGALRGGQDGGTAPRLPSGPASTGLTWEAFNALPMAEQAKVPDSERRAMYAEHGQRVAKG
jgi:hypothetical protein